VGTGLGTIFRYFSYKKWVFLAGAPGTAVAAGEAAVSGIVDPAETSAAGAALAGVADTEPTGAEPTGAVLAEAGPESYGPAWEHLEPADSEVRRR
jgi:hypothetical protein